MDHHPTLSPSAFPGMALCPCFQNGGSNEATERGSAQHELLEHCLKSGFTKVGQAKKEFTKAVDTEGLAEVQYGLDKVLEFTSDDREIETKLSLIDENFEEITFGHADVLEDFDELCWLIDYKSGEEHDYSMQMKVYARMAMDKYGVKSCHVMEVYGRKRWYKEYTLSYEDTAEVLEVIARVNNPDKQPQPCEKCNWCRHFMTCEAVVQHVTAGVMEYNERKGAEDEKFKEKVYVADLPARLASYDASKIEDPKQMQLLLDLLPVLKKWTDSIKQHIESRIIKDGIKVPGYEVVSKSSESLNKDETLAIFHASGLSPEVFTECCTVGITKLKQAVVEAADLKTKSGNYVGIGTKAAREEFNRRFGGLMRSTESVSVKKVG